VQEFKNKNIRSAGLVLREEPDKHGPPWSKAAVNLLRGCIRGRLITRSWCYTVLCRTVSVVLRRVWCTRQFGSRICSCYNVIVCHYAADILLCKSAVNPNRNGSRSGLTAYKEQLQKLYAKYFNCCITTCRVAQLVEALRYKPEGRGFDSLWCNWNFSLT
jgi:hypothetical protein